MICCHFKNKQNNLHLKNIQQQYINVNETNLHNIRTITLPCLIIIFISACKVEDPYETEETQSQQTEIQLREQYFQNTDSVTVTILNENNEAASNVSVKLNGVVYISDNAGKISLKNMPYGNYRLDINASNYLPHIETLSISNTSNSKTITLLSKKTNEVELLFAGDTMFGRRYLDPSLSTMSADIPNIDEALIRPSSASEDAKKLSQYVAPLFLAADFASVNLESPVTGTPQTVHPTKEFAFFSLPETLQGLTDIGIDYVALGNNHVYDFLEDGLDDTIIEVNNAGFAHSGAGKNNQESYAPKLLDVGTIKLGLFSATSIPGNEHEINYVSSETKGGAADLTNTPLVINAVEDTITNSDYSIVQMHGGDEYSYSPTPYIESRFETIAKYGVNLLIAHHPHVAQGFAMYDGVPAILGLGNFMFDQDRLETLLGVAVMVKVDTDSSTPTKRGVVYPVYVEGYQPKFTHGFLSNYLIRRLASLSDDNITLIPRDGYADLYFSKNQMQVTQHTETVSLSAEQSMIDLRDYAPSTAAFLSKIEIIEGDAPTSLKFGRDMMIFGDFEDWDNDDEQLEVARWDHSGDSVTPCISNVRSGLQALCSSRTQFDNTPSIIPFRQTIRTMEFYDNNGQTQAFKDFSLIGYMKGENAGRLELKLVTTTAEDALEFSTEYSDIAQAGTYSWQAFNYNFTLPADTTTLGPENLPARGVKVTFRHFPPSNDEASLALDDIAMVSWQDKLVIDEGVWQTKKMHGFDFLYADSSTPVTYKLTFSTFN